MSRMDRYGDTEDKAVSKGTAQFQWEHVDSKPTGDEPPAHQITTTSSVPNEAPIYAKGYHNSEPSTSYSSSEYKPTTIASYSSSSEYKPEQSVSYNSNEYKPEQSVSHNSSSEYKPSENTSYTSSREYEPAGSALNSSTEFKLETSEATPITVSNDVKDYQPKREKSKKDPSSKKKGKLSKGLIAVIIVLLLLVVGGGVYTIGLGAVDPGNEESVTVVIPTGTGASAIVGILDDAGLVKNVTFAKINARIGGYNSLQANTYIFNKGMSFTKMMKAINTGDFNYISKTSIVINDGLRLQQVAEAMAASDLGLTKDEIMKTWSDKKYLKELIKKYWFLTDEILGEDVMYPLEGYLYADTYILTNENPSVKELTEMCLDRMDEELTARKSEIEASGFTVHQFLTLTSIVTKEARAGDQPKVAGVFKNRLDQDISLGSDVTVCYIYQEDRVELKVSQLESDNPYNTRKFTGLPPGPICAVIGDAMDAVLNYEKTDYLFFFADEDGEVHYFKTEAEFEEGIEKYGMLQDDEEVAEETAE